METETKHEARVEIRANNGPAGELTTVQRPRRVGASIPGRVDLNPADLQALVQYAYDHHGILAEPSLSVELARAEDGLREFADRWGQSLRGQQ